MDDERSTPRRRALRAARVVTLGLVMAAPGCYRAHTPPPDPIEPVFALEDAGARDAGRLDAGGPDAGPMLADACDPADDWDTYRACCDANGWDWDRGCMAWGPFVPPADGEVA